MGAARQPSDPSVTGERTPLAVRARGRSASGPLTLRSPGLQLARALGNRATARLVGQQRSGSAQLLRDRIRVVDPRSTETPESIWNEFQRASTAMEEWDRRNKAYTAHQQRQSRSAAADFAAAFGGKRIAYKPPPVPPEPGPKPSEAQTSWLGVHDIYGGLTETGNESWPDLVTMRYGARGSAHAKSFTVFTGMHGNIGGQFLDADGRIAEAYRDDAHTAEDRAAATRLQRQLAQSDIRVVDVFADADLRRPARLRAAAKAEIAADRVVILAWCFSTEGFKAAPANIPQDRRDDATPDTPEKRYVGERRRMPVKDIVADVFGSNLPAEYMRPLSVLPALRETMTARQQGVQARDDPKRLYPIIDRAASLWAALPADTSQANRQLVLDGLYEFCMKAQGRGPSQSAMAQQFGFAGLA